jgi:hypothetical protein
VDVRWLAYLGSGLLAVGSLIPWATHAPESTQTPPGRADRVDSGPDRALVDVERQAARLREHVTLAPMPRRPSRNPFRFAPGASERTSDDRAPRNAPAPDPRPTGPDVGEPSREAPLALIGMAETRHGESIIRTAIISGAGDVHLVAVGDRVNNRFTVVAIGADAVELRDDETEQTLRLALRQPLL